MVTCCGVCGERVCPAWPVNSIQRRKTGKTYHSVRQRSKTNAERSGCLLGILQIELCHKTIWGKERHLWRSLFYVRAQAAAQYD